jgi:AMP deaminase
MPSERSIPRRASISDAVAARLFPPGESNGSSSRSLEPASATRGAPASPQRGTVWWAAETAKGESALSREDEKILFSSPSMPSFETALPMRIGRQASVLNEEATRRDALDTQLAEQYASLGLPIHSTGSDGRLSFALSDPGSVDGLLPVELPGAYQRIQVSQAERLSTEEDDACRYIARALRLRQKHLDRSRLDPKLPVPPGIMGSDSAPADAASRAADAGDRGVIPDDQLAKLLGVPLQTDMSRYRELFHRRRLDIPYTPLATLVEGELKGIDFRWVDGVVHVYDAAELNEAESMLTPKASAKTGEITGASPHVREAIRAASCPAMDAGASTSPSPGRRADPDPESGHALHPLVAAGAVPLIGAHASMEEFLADYGELCKIIHSAHVNSFCWMRIQLLEKSFDLHRLLNGQREVDEQKTVPHRDFYNVRKVDTHVHHSACMNQKHLLRFIKHKLRMCPDEVVSTDKEGKSQTLAQVFKGLGLSAYDLSVDTLDMQADSSTFHRFDRFNLKYNPIGQSKLREIFLKSDNALQGRYLAEVTKEVFDDLETTKYQMAEYRLSIYGRKHTEWSTLAAWVVDNNIISTNVRWMIQIPRLYQVYKTGGMISTFQDMLTYIFEPLFQVTLNPSSDPKLHQFLTTIVGFDCVDDESKQEGARDAEVPRPDEWDLPFNPPYFYWTYYLAANLRVLNTLRASRGMSTFSFRPHGGEAGDVDHLAACFLLAESVNHGITMRRNPSLQYLYYLDQVGLAMSPLSNNRLFLDYAKNPFYTFFLRGLNVSLSTDDPLLLHYTREPLVEEYCVAAQVFKLTPVDMCEIARTSVLQSGFEHPYKMHFIGSRYREAGPRGNDIHLTNVPSIRLQFRLESLRAERALVAAGARRATDLRTSQLAAIPAPASLPRAVMPPASSTVSSKYSARTPPKTAEGTPGSAQSRPSVLGRALSPPHMRSGPSVKKSQRQIGDYKYTVYSVNAEEGSIASSPRGRAPKNLAKESDSDEEDDSAVRGGRI